MLTIVPSVCWGTTATTLDKARRMWQSEVVDDTSQGIAPLCLTAAAVNCGRFLLQLHCCADKTKQSACYPVHIEPPPVIF
ncbi:hypothetical protein [Bradyrhizobium japonicum]|uniref:hypothetical protein n=1 Tax=Bradyrhizobium japonicum TaxID=375 RepID=UPI001269D451|nr:hypothetical protein [Bradyrhizobium japonicum]